MRISPGLRHTFYTALLPSAFLHSAFLLTFISAVFVAGQDLGKPAGEGVYKQRCAGCHDQNTDRIPPKTSLNQMPSRHASCARSTSAP